MPKAIAGVRFLTFVAILAPAAPARAALITIDVAEFRWTVEGAFCDEANPQDCLSSFSLTYLWSGPAPSPIVSGKAEADSAPVGDFFPLDPSLTFDQLLYSGVPATAEGSISFFFGGPRTLTSPLLSSSLGLFEAGGTPSLTGQSHLFQFEFDDAPTAVPEPGSLALLTLGLLAAQRARTRR